MAQKDIIKPKDEIEFFTESVWLCQDCTTWNERLRYESTHFCARCKNSSYLDSDKKESHPNGEIKVTMHEINNHGTADLIKDRSVYGNYNTHVNQKINDIMRTGFSWSKLTDPQKTSLEMISLKVSRVLNGDPNDVDHWKDIAGYAELIVKELEK